jgi:hypothetical protein
MTPAKTTDSRARALAVLILFATTQLADAWLTRSGIARFGSVVEGNPLLALSLAHFGTVATLGGAKAIALACGALLHARSHHIVLAALTLGCIYAAVLPWTWLLAT